MYTTSFTNLMDGHYIHSLLLSLNVHFSVFFFYLQTITKEEWLANMKAEAGGKIKRRNPRCSICQEVTTRATGHEYFKGMKYCPNEPGQVNYEEWITHRHVEFAIFNS